MNSIDTLAGGDITKWSTVEMLSLAECFLKLRMNKVTNEYHRRVRANG